MYTITKANKKASAEEILRILKRNLTTTPNGIIITVCDLHKCYAIRKAKKED